MTQEKRENFMFTKDTIFYKKLWSLMLPMMLQNLMLALVAVADAFMLGGMDQNYMSAVSLATQIQFIQTLKKRNPYTCLLLQPEDWRFSGHSTGAGAISKRWMIFSVWHCGFVVWCRLHFSLPVSVFHSI